MSLLCLLNRDIDSLNRILNNDSQKLNKVFEGNAPIMVAIELNYIDVAKLLLIKGLIQISPLRRITTDDCAKKATLSCRAVA